MTETTAPAAREAYRDRLLELMPGDPRLVCVDTDTGLFAGSDFGEASSRYIDLGIAEHTAMGVSAALAASGYIPFVNTMATFASTRAVEAVKIDIAQNQLPVRIMATHGGVAAGHLGPTHYALEDLAVMRALTGMTVVVPADADAAVSVVEQSAAMAEPLYVRLGRKPTPPLPGNPGPAAIGRIQPLRDGTDVVIVCCGPHPVLYSLEAADELGADGIGASVLNAHTLKPFDEATLLARAEPARLVVAVEEHREFGGLGGAVAEVLAEHLPRRMLRIALPDAFEPVSGSPDHILKRHGVDPGGIVARVRDAIKTDLPARRPS
jgi:transketolase